VGVQLAVLTPVLAPFTTGETPVRSVVAAAEATTFADCVMVPVA